MNADSILLASALMAGFMTCGLIGSFVFRRSPWAAFVWIPTTLAIGYSCVVIGLRLGAIGRLHDPDAGWGALAWIFLAPAFGACIVGLIGCYMCRPRGAARRPARLLLALVLSLAAFAFWQRQNSSTVNFVLSDAAGAPLTGVRVQCDPYEGGIGKGAKLFFSDGTGKFSMRMGRGETAEFEIMPKTKSPQDCNMSPTFWEVRIRPLDGSPGKLEVRHAWGRPVGPEVVLRESFTEIIPFERQIRIPLTLPPRASLEPGTRRERIRSAMKAFQQNPPHGRDYSIVCRNLESIEFIPELIKTYRSDSGQRDSVIRGLTSIAEILSDLNKGCAAFQSKLPSGGSPANAQHHYEIAQFCVWAEIPYNDQSNDSLVLRQVNDKIAAHAKTLIDFSMDEMTRNDGVLVILAELQLLARPSFPALVTHLREHPPTDMRSAFRWSHVFHMLRARKNELQSLTDSGNPYLQAAARDARP